MYTIGEVSVKMNLSVPTIRYYCSEGLLFNVSRDEKGNRLFTDSDIEALVMINCLKDSGMTIKEIKNFIDLCKKGNESLQERRDFFVQKEKDVLEEIDKLEKTLLMIRYKQWYYEEALNHNDEFYVKNLSSNEIPENIKELFEKANK